MHLFVCFSLAAAQKVDHTLQSPQSVIKESFVLTNFVGDAALGDCNGVRFVYS